jgi:hypothetical protein
VASSILGSAVGVNPALVNNILSTGSVPVGSILGSATGINPNIVPGIAGGGIQLPSLSSIVSGTSGINPNIVPGIGGGGISLSSILGTAGAGSVAGYNVATPGIVPTSGINLGGTLNSALAFVTGSGSALASPVTRTVPSPINNLAGYTLTADQLALQNLYSNPLPVSGTTQTPQQVAEAVAGFNTGATNIEVVGGNFTEFYNSETGLYDVFNNDTGETVQTGLDQQAAILAAQDLSIGNTGQDLAERAINVDPANFPAYDEEGNLLPGYELDGDDNPYFVGFGPIATNAADVNLANFPGYDEEGNLLPGYQLSEDNNPVFVGTGASALNLGNLVNNIAGGTAGIIDQARQQQTVRDQRQNRAQAGDWRVRLRLAPNSNYLYNDPQCGPVLWPLRNTDGVIFPYTPSIDTAYKAEYESYNLTHSNYRGYFYKGSYVDAINIKATFTAQDTAEANYLLATIHFFRSATKMFYGQDAQRGAPPPLVYLSGLGDFQFAEHPCVISQFNYNLPDNVDYIRAQNGGSNGTNLQNQRDLKTVAGNALSYSVTRLASIFMPKGAEPGRLASNTLGLDNPTYVPTKMDISLTLFPMQSREQISKQFSVKNFANGNLLKGGFW